LLWRIYKRFLIAVVVTMLASAGIFAVLFADDWRERARHVVAERTTEVRDVIIGLFSDGLSAEKVEERVRPLLDANHARAAIFSRDGKKLLVFGSHGQKHDGELVWDASLGESVDAHEVYIRFPKDKQPLVSAVSIAVPDDANAVLVAALRGPPPFRFPAVKRALIAILLVLCSGFIMSFMAARALARPIEALKETVERFGSGALDARAPISGRDELGSLAKGFNRMAERISGLLTDKRRLLADVSHELKTPLARLRLSLELARSGESYLDRADAQVDALAKLIDELSFFSRLEAAPYSANLVAEDIAAAVDEEVRAFASDRISRTLAPAHVALDKRLFHRALSNVLKNALTYSPPQEKVSVTGSVRGEHYVIEVADRGPGVEEGEHAKLFQPFYRTDAARTRDTGGTGLGLAIARRCIEAHGGSISSRTRDGGGFVVTITLAGLES
jgi:signal transduction histidine kinase